MRYKHTLTSTGHGDGVSVSTEVVFLTAAVQRAFVVRETVRRTLWTLHISKRGLVEAHPAHWRQKKRDRYVSVMPKQRVDSYLEAAFSISAPATEQRTNERHTHTDKHHTARGLNASLLLI